MTASLAPAGLEDYLASSRASAPEYRDMFLHQGAWHWDIDGCTVENEPVHVQAWIDAAAAYGVRLTDEMFDQLHDISVLQDDGSMKMARQYLRGSDPAVIACWIIGKQGSENAKGVSGAEEMRAEIATIRAMHLSGFIRNRDLLRPREGIEEIIEEMHEENWIVGAVTGSLGDPIFITNMTVLDKVGRSWDFIVAAEEISLEHKKPHPFSYNLGLRKTALLMGFSQPTEGTIERIRAASGVCEDGKSGVIAAYRAGVPVVWVGSDNVSSLEFNGNPLTGVYPAATATQVRAQINKIAGHFHRPAPI